MSLPPLPPSNTERYKVFYTNNGQQHVSIIRTHIVSPATLGAYVDVLLTALNPIFNLTTLDKFEFAPIGSDIFNPVVTGYEGNTYGSGSALVATPVFISFIGRSAGGRKARSFWFGLNAVTTDYRYQPGESAAVDGAVLAVQSASNTWLAIDGTKPTWYNYANAGYNSYWQRQVRP